MNDSIYLSIQNSPRFKELVSKRERFAWILSAIMLGLYAAFEPLAGYSLTEATFRWGALRIVPCFALGCALYLVHRRGGVPFAGPIALVSGIAVLASASLGLWDPITVLFAGGLILLLSGSTPAEAGRMHDLRHILPLPFVEVELLQVVVIAAQEIVGRLVGVDQPAPATGVLLQMDVQVRGVSGH